MQSARLKIIENLTRLTCCSAYQSSNACLELGLGPRQFELCQHWPGLLRPCFRIWPFPLSHDIPQHTRSEKMFDKWHVRRHGILIFSCSLFVLLETWYFPPKHVNSKSWLKPVCFLSATMVIFGQHGILIFSCLLFVLFEKTNPDIFVWSLSLCYTMVGLGIYCPKILCIEKIAEIEKNITNTHKIFLLNCESWQIFALIFHKTNKKIWRISALESKEWSNQKDTGTLIYQIAPN